jgi:thermostable 8-oxoguanine DNA glycosylase
LLEESWRTCADLFTSWARAQQPCEASLTRELLFCLLGGFGVSYEQNRSAAAVLETFSPFDSTLSDTQLRRALTAELTRPQFEPRRSDGNLRRYRYPVRKAELIVEARGWLRERADLLARLTELPDGAARREVLCGCPGVGPKTASWLLRNIGLGADVAIVDVTWNVRCRPQAG